MRRRTTLAVAALPLLHWTAGHAGGVLSPEPKSPPGAPHSEIKPGKGVTAQRRLSQWLPALAGTPGDTAVFVLEGKAPGPTVFVAGGTHNMEMAGVIAATLLVERAVVQRGRLIVVPRANASGASWRDPKDLGPGEYTFDTASGKRTFAVGTRLTRPTHQGAPDPSSYIHPRSQEKLPGYEMRNLNRAHPGKADGNLTQKTAYALTRLIAVEGAHVAFDLHEAGPRSRLAWLIIANPKNVEQAANAALDLGDIGIDMRIEASSPTFRGLSHLEWGEATQAAAYLIETPNPYQASSYDGDPLEELRKEGDYPLWMRVGVQLEAVMAVLNVHNNSAAPTARFEAVGVPSLADLKARGIGAFLN